MILVPVSPYLIKFVLFDPLAGVIAPNELPGWYHLGPELGIDRPCLHLCHFLVNGQLAGSLGLPWRLLRPSSQMLRLHSFGPFGLPSDSCFVINLVSHLDSLFPCLSRHSPELCVRLCHALIDARQSTEHTILLLSELLCVLVGCGALLCHFFAKSLD